MDKVIDNNQVTLVGEIVGDYTFSHEIYGEGFYTTTLKCDRMSDTSDNIVIMVSERLSGLNIKEGDEGKFVRVSGQFRSYNKHEESKNRLVLTVFVREMEFIDEDEAVGNSRNTNNIYLMGYICKAPIYRKTPLGREISDVLLAVNRPYGKSDYIPCICWGRNASFVSSLEVGDCIEVFGRVQSREYTKQIGDKLEQRVAYEVSVSKVSQVAEG